MFGGDFGVFDDARFAAEVAAPFADGALGFLLEPCGFFASRIWERRAGDCCWEDEVKAVHEGVVDGALKAGAFAKGVGSIVSFGFCEFPSAIDFAKVGGPGAVGGNWFT